MQGTFHLPMPVPSRRPCDVACGGARLLGRVAAPPAALDEGYVTMRTTLRASIAIILAAGPAMAATAQESQAGPGDLALEEIVVTGTRLKSTEFDTPNPAVAIDARSIQLSGATNLAHYLTDQPALVGSLDTSQTTPFGLDGNFIGSIGLNLLNLRNLGTDRTLVLVNGRRHVAQLPETASVDINTIPIDLVERIDIVTGGVSAIYGADAVSGVVNFVTRKDFEGFTSRAQWGRGRGGDPEDWHVSATAGMNFADGRGNIAGSVEHSQDGRLSASDRRYLRGANYRTLQRNVADDPDDPDVPDFVPLTDVRFFDSSREGGIDLDIDGIPDVRPDGSPYVINFVPPFFSVGGSGSPRADYIGDLLPESKRTVGSLFLNYEFSEAARFFGELKYAHGKASALSQPTFDYYLYMTADNPFLPAAVASQVIPGIGEAVFGDPSVPDGVLLNRDNFDLGVRGERNTRKTLRTVVGFEGEITDHLDYEFSYTYGESRIRNVSTSNRFNDRFHAALDVVVDPATGQPTCRSNLDPTALPFQPFSIPAFDFLAYGPGELSFTPGPGSGCVPLNLFGEGVASQAAIDWVMTDSVAKSKLTQHVFNAFVSGDVPQLSLPGGPLEYVVGVEWRRETSRSNPPLEDQRGLTFGNVIFPTDGRFNVKEAFAELGVTLLRDRPMAEALRLEGALRLSDYSTVGSTTTWNLRTIWAPVRDISIRGTYAESVRAPNIAELFAPQSQTFGFIDDPCDIDRLNNGSQYRAANCAALLTSLGVDPASFMDPNSANISGLQTGNANLAEETARSWTVGVVLRPRFAQGLSVSVDAYDIKIKDAISTAEAQDVANNCVDQPTLDNVFCDALTRVAGTGRIDSFLVQPENVASFRTRGIDFNIKYLFSPVTADGSSGFGEFLFSVVGSRLNKLTFIPTPGADVISDRGAAFAPRTLASFDLTWTRGPLLVNYGFNYFSKTRRYSLETLAGDPDQASPQNIHYNARHTHDLQVAWTFSGGVQVYGGARNLFNQKPDLSVISPVNAVGRFLYVGARVDFGAME